MCRCLCGNTCKDCSVQVEEFVGAGGGQCLRGLGCRQVPP